MGLETATHISQLNSSWPVGATDPKSQGDDHLRMLKAVLLTDFPGISGAVTATHTELNILDGATVAAAELNILDGATLSTAELNILDGATVSAAELNILDGATLSTAELNLLDGVTVGAADINKLAQIASGPFAPSITNIANAAGLGDAGFLYSRTLNVVTVSGRITITPTTSGNTTVVGIALPVASDLQNAGSAIGAGHVQCGSAAAVAVEVSGDGTNNRLLLTFIANTSSPSSGFLTFIAQYFVQ